MADKDLVPLEAPFPIRYRPRPQIDGGWRSRRATVTDLRSGDLLDTPPFWAQRAELQDALNKIRGRHSRKKRRTILWLAVAEATGMSKREVFGMSGCISQASYYGQWRGRDKETGEPLYTKGLREDPLFAEAFEIAVRLAHQWQDTEEAARAQQRLKDLEDGRDRLASATPFAVETLIHVAEESMSDDTRRKAAVDILTHADEITAPKAQASFTVGRADMRMSDIREKTRNRPVSGMEPDLTPIPDFNDPDATPIPILTATSPADDDDDDDVEWMDEEWPDDTDANVDLE